MSSNVNLGLSNVGPETHPLTWRYTRAGKAVLDIQEYEALEGYSALKKPSPWRKPMCRRK